MSRAHLYFALMAWTVASVAGAADSRELTGRARRALDRGWKYLLAEQHKEGGWHSRTYGSMRGGAAITAMVLYAAADAPPEWRKQHRQALLRGYSFLQRGIRKKGFVAAPDGSVDYPSYATAMTLTAVRKLKIDAPGEELQSMKQFLLQAQLDERREFPPASPHYGGWDLMGASRVAGLTSGTNISVSRFVLEALSADAADPLTRRALTKAYRWVRGCQNYGDGHPQADGGFIFTPEMKSLSNKAQWSDKERRRPRSYGSATCDGLLCLFYTHARRDDADRIKAAIAWLHDQRGLDVVPGFEELPKEADWQEGLRFYYYAALARSLQYPLPEKEHRRVALMKKIISLQRSDGSWRNKSPRMREDDPLIATSLAVSALGQLIQEEEKHAAAGRR